MSAGWTHEEAKGHTVVERLLERCATYGGGTCADRGVDVDDWCERCLAAALLRRRA
jgi:hypothetical protein